MAALRATSRLQADSRALAPDSETPGEMPSEMPGETRGETRRETPGEMPGCARRWPAASRPATVERRQGAPVLRLWISFTGTRMAPTWSGGAPGSTPLPVQVTIQGTVICMA